MGINFVYVGNIGTSRFERTTCPVCGKILIERRLYRVTYYKLENNKCPRCGRKIPIKGKYVLRKSSFGLH